MLRFGEQNTEQKLLKITIPEDLDYEGVFEDLFARYTKHAQLVKMKTSNMGTLYELHYHIIANENMSEKSFLDDLRCRNGNLDILCGRLPTNREEF